MSAKPTQIAVTFDAPKDFAFAPRDPQLLSWLERTGTLVVCDEPRRLGKRGGK